MIIRRSSRNYDHLYNLICSTLISLLGHRLHRKALSLYSSSTFIVLLYIMPLYLTPVLCRLTFISVSAFLLSYMWIDTITRSPPSITPPNITSYDFWSDLKMFGKSPNLVYISGLMGILDHSSVSVEYISGCMQDDSMLLASFTSSRSLLTPPNFRIYLSL